MKKDAVFVPYPPKDSIEGPEDYLKTVLRDPVLSARQALADDRLIAVFQARKLDIDKLCSALEDGANPARVVWKGFPALHLAVMRRSSRAVALLLEHGAPPNNIDSRDKTALQEACDIDFAAAAQMIREAGGEYDAPVFEGNYQDRIDEEVISIIKRQDTLQLPRAIALGADVNAPQFPPLLMAMHKVDAAVIDILLQAGADPKTDHKKYGTVFDQLWVAQRDMLGTAQWMALYDKMAHLAPEQATRMPNPNTMGIPDLLYPMGSLSSRSFLHFLVDEGRIDFIMEVICRDTRHQLTAKDFLKKSKYITERTLIEAIAEKGYLKQFFSPQVWQGRLDEMLSLEKHIPLQHRQSFDFNKAAADIRADMVKQRRDRAKKAGFHNKPPFTGV